MGEKSDISLIEELLKNRYEHLEGDQLQSAQDVLVVFMQAMDKFVERNAKYQDLWKRAGWIANLLQARSKSDRVMHQFWGGGRAEGVAYSDNDLDDAIDALVYGAFFIFTLQEGDAKGTLY